MNMAISCSNPSVSKKASSPNYMENAVPTYVEQTSPEVSARKKSKKTGGVGTIPTDENYVRNAPVNFPEEFHPPRISDSFQPSKW